MRKFSQKGEIVTGITIAVFVILGAISFITATVLNNQKPNTRQSQAAGICNSLPDTSSPNPAEAPPAGFHWVADCDSRFLLRADIRAQRSYCVSSDECAQNTTFPDHGFINPATSNFCYSHFDGGVTAQRCLILHQDATCQGTSCDTWLNPAPTATPVPQATNPPAPPPACNQIIQGIFFNPNNHICTLKSSRDTGTSCAVRVNNEYPEANSSCTFTGNTRSDGAGNWFLDFDCTNALRNHPDATQLGGLDFITCQNNWNGGTWRSFNQLGPAPTVAQSQPTQPPVQPTQAQPTQPPLPTPTFAPRPTYPPPPPGATVAVPKLCSDFHDRYNCVNASKPGNNGPNNCGWVTDLQGNNGVCESPPAKYANNASATCIPGKLWKWWSTDTSDQINLEKVCAGQTTSAPKPTPTTSSAATATPGTAKNPLSPTPKSAPVPTPGQCTFVSAQKDYNTTFKLPAKLLNLNGNDWVKAYGANQNQCIADCFISNGNDFTITDCANWNNTNPADTDPIPTHPLRIINNRNEDVEIIQEISYVGHVFTFTNPFTNQKVSPDWDQKIDNIDVTVPAHDAIKLDLTALHCVQEWNINNDRKFDFRIKAASCSDKDGCLISYPSNAAPFSCNRLHVITIN